MILRHFRKWKSSVNEIVEAISTSHANVSKQLRTLYDSGFLTREQQGKQVFYAIAEPIVFELCELVCDKLNR